MQDNKAHTRDVLENFGPKEDIFNEIKNQEADFQLRDSEKFLIFKNDSNLCHSK